LETIDFAMAITESSFKQEHPEIPKMELKIALFKRFYSNQFSGELLDEIIASMISYFSYKD
jgi:hypothetical protein